MTRTKGELSIQLVCPSAYLTHPHSYETISDLMNIQDHIESFQKMVFAHFRNSANNECRISSLVPLVKESWGIYRFVTSMMRAMYRSACNSPYQILSADRYTCRN